MTPLPDATRAVILARGLGTRMRRPDPATALDPAQAAVADTGVKAMIPIGRPFLDYLLSALADAGIREACLVIGPEHRQIRDRYARQLELKRIRVGFAIQEAPLGTADALLAARAFVGLEPFLVLNSDNYYPPEVLARLRRLGEPGLAAFARQALLRDGNIPPGRIASFAVLDVGPDGYLRRIVEKPGETTLGTMDPAAYVSMNGWLLTPEIFRACREVPPSPRGELELPLAVQYAIDHLGLRFRALPVEAAVLDLSSRADIPAVAARLQHLEVRL